MRLDRDSVLLPLRACAGEVAALRAGAGGHAASRAVVRVAGAVETTLRRFLRDDPTAPVALRLRALSRDDLATAELVAELRRRNRIPPALEEGFRALEEVSARVQDGAEAGPAERDTALSVAEALERHLTALPARLPLEDPVTEPDEPLHGDDDPAPARPVPPASWARSLRFLGPALALLLVAAAAAFGWWWARRDADLRRGEALLREGRTAEAAASLREYADHHPEAPLARVYLARIYREADRPDDAAAELRAGLAAAPGDARLHTEMGFLLLQEGRPAEAAGRFREAVGHDSVASLAWAGLVRALRAAGQPDAADAALSRAPSEVRALLERPAALPPSPSRPSP